MKKVLLLGILTILLTGCGKTAVVPDTKPAMKIDLQQEKPQLLTQDGILAGKTVLFKEFTKEAYDTALQSRQNIILYFYANWCPVCKDELPDLYAAFNQLTLANTVGFRVNYNDVDTDETEKALAKSFDVSYQPTKVLLKNGKPVLTSTEIWDTPRFISEITNAFTPKTVDVSKTHTITMNDDGFTPASLSIKAGDTVTFVNKGTRGIWPASGVHPTHNAYPEKGGCIGSTFDACVEIQPGKTWTFTFTQPGTWSYHDHLRAGNGGVIIVE